MIPTASDILQAAKRIERYIHRTPVLTSSSINQIAKASLFFKCENFQKAGAFKMRGASNVVLSLSAKEKRNGIATHSSGNHAQAVALIAKQMKIKAYVVMPSNAPQVKKDAVKSYGGELFFCKPALQARESTLKKVIEKTGAVFIPPFNHDGIISGQATAALELIQDTQTLDYIFVPVGGGGLLSGTALAAHYFSPGIKVIAGEPAGAGDAYHSLKAGKIIPSVEPATIADGLLTSLGEKTFPIIHKYVKEIVLVSDKEIMSAMKLIRERMKIVVEPSSAVALAAVIKKSHSFKGKNIGIILSGGNVN